MTLLGSGIQTPLHPLSSKIHSFLACGSNAVETRGIHRFMEQLPQEERPRIRMTTQLLREILDSLREDIETLGMEGMMTEGEEVPDQVECASIERVERMLQSCADALLREVQALEKRQLHPESDTE